jgi:tagaturonate reductase
MQLTRENIKNISTQDGLVIPDPALFDLPEKVLQFGTGVLLRGLPDYFIDKANRQGIFNGRIVVVKSTQTGQTDAFEKQDGLYTICSKGIENGRLVAETIINSSISRVLSAREDWTSVLECAKNPQIQIIISNTTEVGIALVEDDIRHLPPLSFPGKLLSFLYTRYQTFGDSPGSGMLIIPTELIPDNGTKLRAIVIELAQRNKLSKEFINWLETANQFCNSLVDRIVPGKFSEQEKTIIENTLGFRDDLMIMAESFRLWAIETKDQHAKELLSFTQADEGAVIASDIGKFRELKLRLLNGTHTFTCGLAYLGGFHTVKETMEDETMSAFIQNLAMQEIVPAITGELITYDEASSFAAKVLDRFRNPYLEHAWANITVQYSSKMKMRNVPLLMDYYRKTQQPPVYMAIGFAAFLLFYKSSTNHKEQQIGSNGLTFSIQDDNAAYFTTRWKEYENREDDLVDSILSDKLMWGEDLSRIPGFADLVKKWLKSFIKNGIPAGLRSLETDKSVV